MERAIMLGIYGMVVRTGAVNDQRSTFGGIHSNSDDAVACCHPSFFCTMHKRRDTS